MINPRNKLSIWHFDGSTYSDYSRKAISFGRDNFSITFETDDYLYIGFDKPINSFFMNFITTNTLDATLSLEYYNDNTTTWNNIDSFDDDTDGFKRSAFMQWNRDLDENEGSLKPDASMPTKFYYRLSTDTNLELVTIQGINVLFSDDNDLQKELYCITDEMFLLGAPSHVLMHEAARDEIVQRFANRGKTIQRNTLGGRKEIIPWDLLQIQEVREASKFLCLHKIFFNMSDAPDDVYHQKSLYYRKLYEEKIDLARLSLDEDDDGKTDEGERVKTIKHQRLFR